MRWQDKDSMSSLLLCGRNEATAVPIWFVVLKKTGF
jgi:hypothetical protein